VHRSSVTACIHLLPRFHGFISPLDSATGRGRRERPAWRPRAWSRHASLSYLVRSIATDHPPRLTNVDIVALAKSSVMAPTLSVPPVFVGELQTVSTTMFPEEEDPTDSQDLDHTKIRIPSLVPPPLPLLDREKSEQSRLQERKHWTPRVYQGQPIAVSSIPSPPYTPKHLHQSRHVTHLRHSLLALLQSI